MGNRGSHFVMTGASLAMASSADEEYSELQAERLKQTKRLKSQVNLLLFSFSTMMRSEYLCHGQLQVSAPVY